MNLPLFCYAMCHITKRGQYFNLCSDYSRSRTKLIISCQQVPQQHCSGLDTYHSLLHTWLSQQLRYGHHKLTLSQCLNIFLAMRVIASDLYHSCGVVTMASTVFLCLISKSISHQKSTTGTSSEVCTRLITLSATHVKLYNPLLYNTHHIYIIMYIVSFKCIVSYIIYHMLSVIYHVSYYMLYIICYILCIKYCLFLSYFMYSKLDIIQTK